MILTDYFYPTPDSTWDFAVQCGVRHGVIRLPEHFAYADGTAWQTLCDRLRGKGIQPLVLEPLPNELHEHIKMGDSKRDECIHTFIKMLPLMRQQGITTVCYNFMAHVGWTRTSDSIPERGGALVTGFELEAYTPSTAKITRQRLWENYAYFIHAVMPEAEKYGIRMALHPDDPPVSRLGDVERIMTSLKNIRQALAVHPSPMHGVTFCQATFLMMGEDIVQAAQTLGKSIFFIHFRNCTGTKTCFHETFHDNGDIDMAEMIALYERLGLKDTAIRVDHVPRMATESGGTAGYTALGRLYALGYLRGLLEMRDHLIST